MQQKSFSQNFCAKCKFYHSFNSSSHRGSIHGTEIKPQQLQSQKRVQNEKKKQNRRPEPRKHTKDPPEAPLFFGTMRLFETFWIAPKGPPSFASIFCNTMDVKKSQRVPPFTFFGTVTLFKISF